VVTAGGCCTEAGGNGASGSPSMWACAFSVQWAFRNMFDGMGLVLDDRTRELDLMILPALSLNLASRRRGAYR
jgi:hypothetical protein